MAYWPEEQEYYEADVVDPTSGAIGAGVGTAAGILGGALIGAFTGGLGAPVGAALGAAVGGSIGGAAGQVAGVEKKMVPVGTPAPGAPPLGRPPIGLSEGLQAAGIFRTMKEKEETTSTGLLSPPPSSTGVLNPSTSAEQLFAQAGGPPAATWQHQLSQGYSVNLPAPY